MSAIKRFFQKKKLDVKFKKAGGGHRLSSTEASSSSGAVSPSRTPSSRTSTEACNARTAVSDEARRAAEAALTRCAQNKTDNDDHMLYLRARMKREMEAEKKSKDGAAVPSLPAEPEEVILDNAPVLSHVLFNCPDIGPAVLPKKEMEDYIAEFLMKQLAEEPEMASALMIQTLNKNKDHVKICVDTITKYLDNIIAHPTEEKFRKIRVNNKAFQERVASLNGTSEFLQSVGFKLTQIQVNDTEESFYVIDEEFVSDIDRLQSIGEILLDAEPIKPQLDRDLKVFFPSKSMAKFEIPDEFYNISPEELKKEQKRQSEAVEKLGMLRTKAMREREEQRELRRYRYTLIRIRLPDGIILQGTFRSTDKISCAYEFVRELIINDWMPFELITSAGHKLKEDDITFAEGGLVPASVINFAWNDTIMKEVAAQQGIQNPKEILKPEVMLKLQDL